jgi:predicted HTH domain antitoxin
MKAAEGRKVMTMKNEYDFSGAERGKFFRKDAVLELPVYLDASVRDYLTARAKAKGLEVNELVNELLKRDIELIEVAK